MPSENTTCAIETRVKVERKPDQVTQTYVVGYSGANYFPNMIIHIVYTKNIQGIEGLEISFNDAKMTHGTITRYDNSISIDPDFSDFPHLRHLSLNERLKSIDKRIMEQILNQISPESKNLLEEVLE